MAALDSNGVRLTGFITHNQGKGARVVWHEGVLYVLRSLTDIAAFPGVDQPTKWGGGWKTLIGEKALLIQKPGCSCKKDATLGALTLEQIITMASEMAQ